jgi:hypothetical protein
MDFVEDVREAMIKDQFKYSESFSCKKAISSVPGPVKNIKLA